MTQVPNPPKKLLGNVEACLEPTIEKLVYEKGSKQILRFVWIR